jgi:hypothetical protein
MSLTIVEIKNAKPHASDYRLADSQGLFLHVTSAGGKFWRYRYRIGPKEKTLTLGRYPEVGLVAAREAHYEARKLVSEGNPALSIGALWLCLPESPHAFHRIRHYGLLAGSSRKASLALARDLLHVAPEPEEPSTQEPVDLRPPCPCCGSHMIIIETFERWRQPRAPPVAALLIREHAS